MSAVDPPVPCPICRTPTANYSPDPSQSIFQGLSKFNVTCPRCGKFASTQMGEELFKPYRSDAKLVAAASGWIRHHQGFILGTAETVNVLLEALVPSLTERADHLLEAIAKEYPDLGATFELYFHDPRWLGASYSATDDDVEFIAQRFLVAEKKFLEAKIPHAQNTPGSLRFLAITPAGHSFLADRRIGVGAGAIGFCAMWFDASVQPLWDVAIEPAIRDAGYASLRIDGKEHNNKIDDEILSSIRNAKFVVADFTGQRGGVYFEAGFAAGQGIPVIWLARKDEVANLHFDTRQYNHIDWEPSNLSLARKRIADRIIATIGIGSLGKLKK